MSELGTDLHDAIYLANKIYGEGFRIRLTAQPTQVAPPKSGAIPASYFRAVVDAEGYHVGIGTSDQSLTDALHKAYLNCEAVVPRKPKPGGSAVTNPGVDIDDLDLGL